MTKVSSPPHGGVLTPRHVRFLKIAIAIMTVLLILGILALVYGVMRQASKLGAVPGPGPVAAQGQAGPTPYWRSLELGQGKLEGVMASGDVLVLHWKSGANDLVVTMDPRSGHELGRIQIPRP